MSLSASRKRSKYSSQKPLFLALIVVALFVVVYSVVSLLKKDDSSVFTDSQSSSSANIKQKASPILNDATKELQTADKSIQSDLDITDLEKEIDSIVIE